MSRPSSAQLNFILSICEVLGTTFDDSKATKQDAYLFIQKHIKEFKIEQQRWFLDDEFANTENW